MFPILDTLTAHSSLTGGSMQNKIGNNCMFIDT